MKSKFYSYSTSLKGVPIKYQDCRFVLEQLIDFSQRCIEKRRPCRPGHIWLLLRTKLFVPKCFVARCSQAFHNFNFQVNLGGKMYILNDFPMQNVVQVWRLCLRALPCAIFRSWPNQQILREKPLSKLPGFLRRLQKRDAVFRPKTFASHAAFKVFYHKGLGNLGFFVTF